jgi:hypothetical protein
MGTLDGQCRQRRVGVNIGDQSEPKRSTKPELQTTRTAKRNIDKKRLMVNGLNTQHHDCEHQLLNDCGVSDIQSSTHSTPNPLNYQHSTTHIQHSTWPDKWLGTMEIYRKCKTSRNKVPTHQYWSGDNNSHLKNATYVQSMHLRSMWEATTRGYDVRRHSITMYNL